MKDILLYLWQLPQNALGLLFLLFIRGEEKHSLNGISFYYAKNFNGGISLGRYIILSHKWDKSVKHEYGHCKQSQMLGWMYLLIIGIPSIINAMVCKDGKRYYHFYTEKWADKIGGVKR
jgi:hypothetical protein